jgi:dGTPase
MTPACAREEFERRNDAWLAPHAVRERDSGGRLVDEPPHRYRTCFQRDRDRIVHCAAFRRLDFKTQVFVPHEHDHFRTRLTHTLEVAQVGRTIGRALRLNEDLIEAAALAHDLGHPPFGHTGESALNELMAGHGHFEHNRQSLRVVDYLEHPYPQFRGLNLTRVVRECLAKHTSRYDTPQRGEFDDGLSPPLEGQLVDVADEIAYTSADLEDALSAGWLDTADVESLSLWAMAHARAAGEAPAARPVHHRIRAVKYVLAALADDAIDHTAAQVASSGVRELQDVRRSPRLVGFSPAVAAGLRELGDLLMRRVYMHPENLRQVKTSKTIIAALFEAYTRDADLLPARYRQRVEVDGLHRVACDYIAGMTDRYCRTQYAAIEPKG